MQEARQAFAEKLERESDPKQKRRQRQEEERQHRLEERRQKEEEEQRRMKEWSQRQRQSAARTRQLNEEKRRHWQKWDDGYTRASRASCGFAMDAEDPVGSAGLADGDVRLVGSAEG